MTPHQIDLLRSSLQVYKSLLVAREALNEPSANIVMHIKSDPQAAADFVHIDHFAAASVIDEKLAVMRQELAELGFGTPACPVAEAIMPEIRQGDECGCKSCGPDHLWIEISGPQGCSKTQVAEWLAAAFAYFSGETPSTIKASDLAMTLRQILPGKRITITDGTTAYISQ